MTIAFKTLQIQTIILLAFLFATRPCWASCTVSTTNGLAYYTFNVSGVTPTAFDPTAYTIGQTIYKGSGTVSVSNYKSTGPTNPTINCTESTWTWTVASLLPAVNGIFPSSVAGLGLKISSTSGTWPLSLPASSTFSAVYNITVELIKTGDITAGGVLSNILGEYRIQPSNQLVAQVTWANPVLIKPSVPTCTVSTPNITVPLLNPSTTTFRGVGSTFGIRPFQIGLVCTGGSTGTSTNTYITFTDLNQPGNTSTALSLASATGTATGLGLQILNNGTPIGYGPDSNAPGNTNQWKVTNIAQGVSSYVIPLSVRYIQTGSTVTPGTVTGRATFTMSYQ
ncbi:fimbrial protein [Aquitalea sp. USM4]|uniref:fimbrial protein n=1 Tax=Aquitalea sp. USM4 TaxID=1590041 RepID=UPI00103C370D|nr:fimbrial protein [Aquitalea sp. USM4]QBJ78544.1 type 1 fimbrial protein [Aquitalea sp. USM4]